MKRKTRKIVTGAAIAVLMGGAFGGISAWNGVKSSAEEQATKSLEGFTSAGASVFIATDGSGEKQMRFQIDLAKAQAAYAAEGKTAGVVVLPYDMYRAKGLTELTKDTADAVNTDVTSLWKENADGTYTSYAYLEANMIPEGQYNRALMARGYIVDGENVYYTEEVKASMAYVAWKNIGMDGGAYDTQLKEYMGEYTLTYGTGENEKIDGLYYGDTFYDSLPATIGGLTVEKWYWNEEKTQEILATDYATGTMNIYYELQKFDVTGTLACADEIDLTKIKVYANGEDAGATVAENGAFTCRLSAGTYNFVFEGAGYIAYADGVEVSENVEAINATLKNSTYAIGDYKNSKVSSGVTYDKVAALEGSVTVSGNKHFMLPMPNTATKEACVYTVSLSEIAKETADFYYGFGLSNGEYVLSFSFSHWNWLRVNVGKKGGTGAERVFLFTASAGWSKKTAKIVRTSDEIKLYVNGSYVLTVTKDGIQTELGGGWGGIEASNFAGFFGEDAELALTLISTGNEGEYSRTYSYSVNKLAAVSGKIECSDSGVDLTTTTLKADGIEAAITVNADGTYIAMAEIGERTLAFSNGKFAASVTATVDKNGAQNVNVKLVDGTWLAGDYKNVKSTQYPELNESGVYSVTGEGATLIFPNTATTGAFTYEALLGNVDGNRGDKTVGICLTDGTHRLSVGLYRFETIVVELDGNVSYYDCSENGQYWRGKLTFAVASDKIELYVNENPENPEEASCKDVLCFTFTSSEIVLSDTVTNRGWSDTLTANYAANIQGFFGENAEIACGIFQGWGGSTTATYTCKIEKN